jgi:hypothetical protein
MHEVRDILIALGILLVMIVLFCVFIFWPAKQVEMKISVLPTPTPTPVSVSISVLNGSGVVGAAGTAAEKLRAAGFEVVNIGNADRSNYKKTRVTAKRPLDPKILEALGKTSDQVDIATGSGDVIEIILGASK